MFGMSEFLIMARYQRKTDRQNWSQESMTIHVLEENNNYKRAFKAYSVPHTTIERKVKEA
ncbi:unnamed protein product [Larinioides sclopetarius]|uniref:HTH psq-type domain-containing protein n=1 Tax=Larinioides sclopetarius TaxID=280406 RepID=A0AAV1ZE54_9ARAC